MVKRFHVVFFSVPGVVLCGALATALLASNPAPPMVGEMFNTSCKLFTAGGGAIIGLLGGKAAA